MKDKPNVRKPPYHDVLRLHLPYERGKCQWCGEPTDEVTPAKKLPRMWHANCEAEFQIIINPEHARRAVWDRDRGICAECGENWGERYRFAKGVEVVIYIQPRLDPGNWRARGFYRYSEVLWISLWHVDHVVPLWKVRSMEPVARIEYFKLANLQTLCDPCHGHKSATESAERAHYRAVIGENKERPKRQWPKGRKLTGRGFQKRVQA